MLKKHQFESLDSVRGIAAAVVVIHHLICGFQPDLVFEDNVVSPMIRMLYNGSFAVHVFFILSGFVLSHSFVASGNMDVLRAAAIKRYWRLFIPVAVSIGISYALLTSGAYENTEAAMFMGQPPSSWLNLWYRFPPSALRASREAVYDVFIRYNIHETYNATLWTMRTEFIGSYFIFAFHAFTYRLRNRPLVYLLLAVIFQGANKPWLIDFLAGSALCELSFHKFKVPFPVGLLVCGLLMPNMSRAWLTATFGHPLIPEHAMKYVSLLGATAVISGVVWSDKVKSALSVAPLLLLGRISFPLYLIHFPIECSLGCHVYIRIAPDVGHTWASVIASVATIVSSLGLALIGAFTVEPWSIGCGKWVYERWFRGTSSK